MNQFLRPACACRRVVVAVLSLLILETLQVRSADPAPARIGTLEVQIQIAVSGESSGNHSDAAGSFSWSESFNFTLSSRATYEVLQRGTNAVTGKQLEGNASRSVTGGGSSQVTSDQGPITGNWSYLAPSGFDPARSVVSGSISSANGQASVGTGFRPGAVIDPPDAAAMASGLEAAGEAFNGVGSGFLFDIPRAFESWSRSGSRSTNVNWSMAIGKASGTATITASARFEYEGPPQWEAIMEAGSPLESYDTWLPLGNLDKESDRPGNSLPVRVTLQAKGGGPGIPPKANFTVTLVGASREPGILMNFPRRAAAGCDASPQGPFDLKIQASGDLDVAEDGQSASTTRSLSELRVGVACYDFGAFGHLRVAVRTDDGQEFNARPKDQPAGDSLGIPLDDNGNKVADAWEKSMEIYDRNLTARWDAADDPAGQAFKGDGVSLYEKYRGFLVLNSMGKEVYERLNPLKKHLFVRNPDRVVRETFAAPEGLAESYMAAAECEVRYVGMDGWTGPGRFGDRKRVVNFNCSDATHAVDQHALHVAVVTSPNPAIPQDYTDFLLAHGMPPVDPLERRTEGVAYPDHTAPARAITERRPAADFRIEIYAAGVTAYIHDTVVYHSGAACPACTPEELSREATNFARANPSQAARKRTIELSATITHEMGHGTGVPHHAPTSFSPTDNTLKNCTMRYYEPDEFPRDASDRFELEARGNNPDSFCRRKFNCWHHLTISDDLDAAAGAWADEAGEADEASTPAVPARAALQAGPRPTAVPGLPIPTTVGFELSADLAWEELVEGDPLRFSVRLHGLTDSLTADWVSRLALRLVRLRPDDRTEEVIPPDAWSAYRSPNGFETTDLAVPNVTRISEWLAPAAVAGLTPGPYRLEISWNGRGLAPDLSLPTNGLVVLAPMLFEVIPATNAPLQALHQRHLAWEHFVRDDPSAAAGCVRQAEQLDPNATDPDAVQTRLIGAHAALRMQDALGVVRFLDRVRSVEKDDNDHLAAFAEAACTSLAPRLQWSEPPSPANPLGRLQVRAMPGGTYVVQQSSDLRTWTSISTNTPASSGFTLDPAVGAAGQFYRVVWER